MVQLSSCMTKDNFHGLPCLHLDYSETLIARAGIDVREDTRTSDLAEKRRQQGLHARRTASDGENA